MENKHEITESDLITINKYKTQSELKHSRKKVWNKLNENELLLTYYPNMKKPFKYTHEDILNIIKDYKNITELEQSPILEHRSIHKYINTHKLNGFYFPNKKKQSVYTDEYLINLASKYKTMFNFFKEHKNEYEAIYRRGENFIKLATGHLIKIISSKKRCIYCITFSDNAVYIGLSANMEGRIHQHLEIDEGTVDKYIKNNLVTVKEVKMIEPYMDAELVGEKEIYYIQKYKDDGYKIINKHRGGSLGGSIIKWNRENCTKEIQKYKTRTDLQRNSGGCYEAICQKYRDLLDEFIPKSKNKHTVYLYDINMNFIQEFNSKEECGRFFNKSGDTIASHINKNKILNDKYYLKLKRDS